MKKDTIEVCRIINQEGSDSKYKINNTNVTQNAVLEMFESVHLNIDHSRFIVMQGQITKVVTSNPHDIMAMIEETSGTASFKNESLRLERTLKESENNIKKLEEEIKLNHNPTLEKCRETKINLDKLAKNEKQMAELSEEINKMKYQLLRNKVKDLESDVGSNLAKINQLKDEQTNRAIEIDKIKEANINFEQQQEILDQKIIDIKKQKGKEDTNLFEVEKDYTDLEFEILALNKKVAEMEAKLDKEKHTSERQAENKYAFKDKLFNYQSEWNQKAQLLEQLTQKLKETKSSGNEDSNEYKADLKKQIEISSDKVENINKEISNFESKFDLKNEEQEVKKLQKMLKDCDSDAKMNEEKCENLRKNVDEKKKYLLQKNSVKEKINNLSASIRDCKQKYDAKKQELFGSQEMYEINSRSTIDINPPKTNFNLNSIYGRIIDLFRVKDDKFSFSLEVIAGGNIFGILVKD